MWDFLLAVLGWVLVSLPALPLVLIIIRGVVFPDKHLMGTLAWILLMVILVLPIFAGLAILLGPNLVNPIAFAFHPIAIVIGLLPAIKFAIDMVKLAWKAFGGAYRNYISGKEPESEEKDPWIGFCITADFQVFGQPRSINLWQVTLAPENRMSPLVAVVRGWATGKGRDPDEEVVRFFAPLVAKAERITKEQAKSQIRYKLREFKAQN